MATAIKIENLSKQYRLGLVSTRTLSHDLNRWWQVNVRGKEDPYLKIGDTNDRATKGESEYVWALKEVNLEVEVGEVLGIIGKNGAGKSTLLKILSKVTAPTTGTIKARGRIASLLEVGTGFHAEMTGRENIFLNGAILGMTKAEIRRKLEEIIDFAGVERYIDTPVKRYSSGMLVRLGFAVAAFLEPEILIVDEVLAVGDAEFQKKAISKMKDVSQGQGRTVLFVSHNMTAIKNLCKNAVLIENGKISFKDEVNNVVQSYQSFNTNKNVVKQWEFSEAPSNQHVKILSIKIVDNDGEVRKDLNIESNLFIKIEFIVLNDNEYVGLTLLLLDKENNIIFSSINNHETNYYGKPMKKGKYISTCSIPSNFLNNIDYSMDLLTFSKNFTDFIRITNVLYFNLEDPGFIRKDYFGNIVGFVRPYLQWKTMNIE